MKNKIIITFIIGGLIAFLRYVNILQIENGFGHILVMLIMTVAFSMIAIFIQNRIDKSFQEKHLNYHNLDILKYISAILILVLHLRPFQNFSNELDLAFNNIVTRVCVPIFFVITGYFVAKKEVDNPDYIRKYVKNTIPMYLGWSLIYIPITIGTIIQYLPSVTLPDMSMSIYVMIPLCIISLPLIVLIALFYTGVYYHLWYFPAIILSLIFLAKWKKKWNIKYLLMMSFVLLLFGATETYYGVLPLSIKQLVTYYFNIFFTTRNFLFFGLFYVVLGFYMGLRENLYSKYCFEKLVVCFFMLIFEAIILHDFDRLDSNILLSCIPLTYYLFISVINMPKQSKLKINFSFRDYSKYYYLIHPMVIFILSCLGVIEYHPLIQIVFVLSITHLISMVIIKIKKTRKLKIPI